MKRLDLKPVIYPATAAGSTPNHWDVASLKEPFGTTLGLMENPHYNR